MDKNNNPMSRLMELAAPYKSKYVLSVIMAVLGVAAGLLPFFAVSKIVVLLMNGETTVSVYMEWCLFAGLGFLAKVCFSNLSTLVSHTATFATTRNHINSFRNLLVLILMPFLFRHLKISRTIRMR